MIKWEFLIFLGLALALGIAELVATRRAIRRARQDEARTPDRLGESRAGLAGGGAQKETHISGR